MGNIIWLISLWGCAAIFLGIGLYSGARKTPANFWSGVLVDPASVSDTKAYNQEMKKMWCLYSLPYWVSGAGYARFPMESAVVLVIASTAGIVWLILRYKKIEKKYIDTSNIESRAQQTKGSVRGMVRSSGIVAVILILCAFFLVTGDITVTLSEEGIQAKASYWPGLMIPKEELQTVTYRTDFHVGMRTNGFGSYRLRAGNFRNDELGNYMLYAYTGCDDYIQIETGKKIILVNLETASDTKELYHRILIQRKGWSKCTRPRGIIFWRIVSNKL